MKEVNFAHKEGTKKETRLNIELLMKKIFDEWNSYPENYKAVLVSIWVHSSVAMEIEKLGIKVPEEFEPKLFLNESNLKHTNPIPIVFVDHKGMTGNFMFEFPVEICRECRVDTVFLNDGYCDDCYEIYAKDNDENTEEMVIKDKSLLPNEVEGGDELPF